MARDTLAVGNALSSVRIDQMILNLAKGIAWGQFELDQVGVQITKMMGAPGTVSIGGEQLSMLEAGFIPSFYHFVDTILELKMEINIREESSSSTNVKTSQSGSVSSSMSASISGSGSYNMGFFKARMSMSASYSRKATSAYSRSLDSTSSQKFSQDLSASSLMRTKLVPVPPPELLVERIKILLEKLRKEAEEAEEKSETEALENLGNKLLTIGGPANFDATSLDSPSDELKDHIYEAFKKQTDYLLLKKMEITAKGPEMEVQENGKKMKVKKWIVRDKAENKYVFVVRYKDAETPKEIEVYSGGETQKDLFDFGELLNLSAEEEA